MKAFSTFFPGLVLFLFLSPVIHAQVSYDIGVSAIDSPLTGFCGNTKNIFATVKNYGPGQVDSFTLNWSVNGALQAPVKYNIPIDTNGGVSASQLLVQVGDYTFETGIQSRIKVWTSFPNGQPDVLAGNDSSVITRTATLMKGTYTVDPSGSGALNFISIDAAVAALNANGICGPVTFSISPGTYLRSTSVSIGNIAGASAVNKIVFQGSGSVSCVFRGNVSGPIILANESKYITFRDLSLVNTATSNAVALGVVGSSRNVSVINCMLEVPVVSGSSEAGCALNFTGNTTGVGYSSCGFDSVLIENNTFSGGGYGIVFTGANSLTRNRELVIRNNALNEMNSYGIYIRAVMNGVEISGNKIRLNLGSAISKGIIFTGNTNASAKPHAITTNHVYHFSLTGIQCNHHIVENATAATLIANNVLYGSSTSASGDINGIILLTNLGNYPARVYHNTVVVMNSQQGVTSSFAALNHSGSFAVDVKNNVFCVKGGNVLPMFSGFSMSPGSINYNLYYNSNLYGNLIRSSGTYYNRSDFKTAGGDSSYTDVPPFINVSHATPDLRLKHGCFAGVPTNLILTDILGASRSANPTIGAYESASLADNIGVVGIVSPSVQFAPIIPGLQDLKYVVINAGNNIMNQFQASYKVNQGAEVNITRITALQPCATDTVIFTGINGLNVQASQDLQVYVSGPNNMPDTDRAGDTLQTMLVASLKGTYNVGAGTDIAGVHEAVEKAKTLGVCGHVIFNIKPGTYSGQVKISGTIPGLCDTATITFEGNHADSVILTASTTASTVLIDQLSYITISNISIINTQAGTGLAIYSPSAQKVTNCTITKCRISVPVQTVFNNTGTGIMVTGTPALSASAAGCDSLYIDSNIITGGGSGIVMTGVSDTLKNTGMIIRDNNINNCSYSGISLTNIYNPVVIESNRISMLAIGNSFGHSGIRFVDNRSYHSFRSHVITRNRIYNFQVYGMYIVTTNAGTNAAPAYITNNEIISSSAAGVLHGIFLNQASASAASAVLHNTVYMRGRNAGTNLGAFSNYGSTETEIKNNIFVVISGGYYPVYTQSALTGNRLNYNLYYNSAASRLVYRGSAYTSANYKTITAGGDSSYNTAPPFYSTDSLAFNLALVHKCFVSATAPTAVDTDINNNKRDSVATTGAYEAADKNNDLSLEQVLSPVSIALMQPGAHDVKLVIKNVGKTPVMDYQAAYSLNAGPAVLIRKTGSLNRCANDTVTFSGVQQVNLGLNNRLKLYISSSNGQQDPNPLNDTLVQEHYPTMRGTYTIGRIGDFPDFKQAIAMLVSRGMTGTVTFMIQPGTYTGPVYFTGTIKGQGPGHRIVFDGGCRDSVKIIADTGQAVFAINRQKYVTLKNISFVNLKAGVGVAVVGGGVSEGIGCEIKQCRITLPVQPGTSQNGAGVHVSASLNGGGRVTTSLDSLLVDSNLIYGGANGILFYGAAYASGNRMIRVSNNTIDSSVSAGINMFDIYNPLLISGNELNMRRGDAASVGIRLANNKILSGTHVIERNRIYNFGRTGILSSDNASSAAANQIIVNNIIVSADSMAEPNNGYQGIFLNHEGPYQASVFHNTVVMRGGSQTGEAYAFETQFSSNVLVKNNIFAIYGESGFLLDGVASSTQYVDGNMYYKKNDDPWNPVSNAVPLFKNINGPKPDVMLLRGCDVATVSSAQVTSVDVWGNKRNGLPTVGAVELIQPNLSVISLVPFAKPVAAGVQELKLCVRNTSTDSVFTYQTSYILNGNTPVSLIKSVVLKPCQVDTVVFSGTNRPSLDVKNEFKVFTNLPGAYPDDDTLVQEIHTALSGNYTIGSSGYFLTFKAATNALQSGMVGPVKFIVQPGTYAEQLLLQGPLTGASAVNTLSFEGAGTHACILRSDSAAVIQIANIPYISIAKLGLETSRGNGINCTDKGLSNPTSVIRIRNCAIKVPVSSTASAIRFSNSRYDSLTIDSNIISGGTYGIIVTGITDELLNRSTVISNNQISEPYETGIYVSGIFNPVHITGNALNLRGQSTSGIYLLYNTGNAYTSRIHTSVIRSNKVSNFTGYGIYASATGDYCKAEITVVNNALASAKTGVPSQESAGIYLRPYGSSKVNVYHNSVAMQGLSTHQSSAALHINGDEYKVKNNILAVYSGGYLPLYLPFFNSQSNNDADYNLYYNSSPTHLHTLVRAGSFNMDSSNFRNRLYAGDSSMNVEPPFVSRNYFPANLALTDYCSLNRGLNLGGLVTMDIDNRVRATLPAIGAFEFQAAVNNLSVKGILSPFQSDSITSGLHDISYWVINAGTNPVNQYTANYYHNSAPVYSKLRTVSLAPCQADTVTFTSLEKALLRLTDTITTFTTLPNGVQDADVSGDTVRAVYTPLLAGEYTIGPVQSDFVTINQAVNRLAPGISGQVKFMIRTGTYPEFITFKAVKGASQSKTITFTSQAGAADSVRIYRGDAGSRGYGTGLFTFETAANYYKLHQLTIETDATPSDYVITLVGAPSFDTISNCIIRQPISTYWSSTYNKTTVYGDNYSGEGFCFLNNNISGGYYNISFQGISRITPIKNLVFDGNEFGNSNNFMPAMKFGRGGRFSNNKIMHSSATSAINIEFAAMDSGFVFASNQVTTLPGKHVDVRTYDSRNSTLNKGMIVNNVITQGGASGVFRVSQNCLNMDVMHNSIGASLILDLTGCEGIRIFNNVVHGSGSYYSINNMQSPTSLVSDYNAVVAYSQGSSSYTPYQFKINNPSLEVHSIPLVPSSLNAVTGMPQITDSLSWVLNGTGTHIGYVLNDKNGIPRPQTFIDGGPDIGAYEFTPANVAKLLSRATINSTIAAFLMGSDTIAKIKWTGTLPVSAVSGRVYTGAYPPNIFGNTHKSLNQYWDFNGPSGSYTYDISLYYRYPLRGSIASIANMIGTKKRGSDPWTFYQVPSITIDSARNILTIKGLTDFGIFTGTDQADPLPVKLLKFEGVTRQKDVLLKWTTAEEKNISHFEVHASDDGINFEQVGEKVFAKGGSAVTTYQHVDLNAFSNVNKRYYLLRSVDLNGDFEWSGTIIVSISAPAQKDILVYPNPFNDGITINVNADVKTMVSISDIQGKELFKTIGFPENKNIKVKGLEALKAGVYFVNVKCGDEIYTKKLIKK